MYPREAPTLPPRGGGGGQKRRDEGGVEVSEEVGGGRRRSEGKKKKKKNARRQSKAFVAAAPCVSGRLHCYFLPLERSDTAAFQQRRDQLDTSNSARPPEPAISIRERESRRREAAAIDDDDQRASDESREESQQTPPFSASASSALGFELRGRSLPRQCASLELEAWARGAVFVRR